MIEKIKKRASLAFLIVAFVIMLLCGQVAQPTVNLSPLAVRFALSPVATGTPLPVAPPLVNPGFELPYRGDPTKDNIRTADGWLAWWAATPLCYNAPCVCPPPAPAYLCPDNCQRKTAQPDGLLSLELVDGMVTVTLETTRPVSAIEAQLYYPAGAVDVFTHSATSADATTRDKGALIRYQREISGSIVGRDTLFTADLSLPDDLSGTLELVYFVGHLSGGWSGGWFPGVAAARRLTISLASAAPRCSVDYGCWFAEPECKPSNDPFRVRSGYTSQACFVFGRQGDFAVYQRVENVTPGAMYRFSVWAMAWQCSKGCPTSPYSDEPYDMGLRVGIDPAGGADPLAPGIVWSQPSNSFDVFSKLEVMARAQGNAITVFVWASPRFDWARINNDVYLDDAELVYVWTPKDFAVYLPLVFSNWRAEQ